MKKDIEWFKERVSSKIKSAELNVMAHREGLSEDFESRLIAYKSVLKDINQLDKQETLSQEWIDKYAQGDYGAWVYTKDLQNLLVPKRELPVIPNYVAKWISERHEIFDLYYALKTIENNDVYEWYRKNTLKFVNAYLTGEYEVEEKQKYVVKIPTNENNDIPYAIVADSGDIWTDALPSKYKLTEEEIRGLTKGDVLFEHFAVKVEEFE